MRTYTHPQGPRVKFARLLDKGKLGTGIMEIVSRRLGEVHEIRKVSSCTGKTANSSKRCMNGGPPKCPGRIQLDIPGFDMEGGSCWCWGDASIFDFIID
jgi:hypothetical protein